MFWDRARSGVMIPSKSIVVSCVYPPQAVVSARTSADVARVLKTQFVSGVICPALDAPRSLSPDEPEVVEVPEFVSRQSEILSRFVQYFSFGLASGLALLRERRADVVYINSWPLVGQGFAVFAARCIGSKVVRSIQDLYPESLVAQRRITNGSWLQFLMQNIDESIGRSCDINIFIGKEMRVHSAGSRGELPGSIVIPNWIDPATCVQAQRAPPRNRIVIAFAGNIGVASGLGHWLPVLTDASFRHERICWRFAGSGSMLGEVQAVARDNAEAFDVVSPWPAGSFEPLDSAAIGLVSMLPGQQAASIPSKFLTYIARGLPVLLLGMVDTEVTRLVTGRGIGWVANDRDQLLAALRAIVQTPEAEWSRIHRAVSEVRTQFGADLALERIRNCLNSVLDSDARVV